MAVRGRRDITIDSWLGLQTFASAQNLGPGWFTDSSNIIVTNDGSAAVVRSPKTVTTSAGSTYSTYNLFNYDKVSGSFVLLDYNLNTYSIPGASIASAPTSLFANGNPTGGGGKAKFLTVNNRAYRIAGAGSGGGTASFKSTDGSAAGSFDVGIGTTVSSFAVSYVAGGAGSYTVGVSVSMAYYNSTTGQVGLVNANQTHSVGATGANHKIRFAPTASAGDGIDGIVAFITADGGSIRYLLVDVSGNMVVFPNTTTNNDISIDAIFIDTQTPETVYNEAPPSGPYFMFKYGNRLCICDFRTAANKAMMQYSGQEVIALGVPWECWPSQNQIFAPNKGDSVRGGTETPLGALLQGEEDSYLVRGTLSDKVSTPANPIAITESIQAMGWSIGTKSPFTTKITPFGVMWLDQNKRIQLWTYTGFPTEAGLPIRNLLNAIDDDTEGRFQCDAEWYQHGKDGGLYIVTAPVSDVFQQFTVTVYRDPETNQLKFACGVLDTKAQCLAVCKVANEMVLLQGGLGSGIAQKIVDLDTAGSGWTAGTELDFSTILGNDSSFTYWHSFRFDATSTLGLTLTIANLDGTDSKVLTILDPGETGGGGPYYGLLDTYGYRKVLTFTYSTNDTVKRVVNNLMVITVPKARVL